MELRERISRVKLLEQKGSMEALHELVSFLNDREPAVRAQAAISLSAFHSPTAVRALLLALGDGDAAVRCLACASLGKIGDASALRRLRELAERDADERVREYARDAIRLIGEKRPVGEFKLFEDYRFARGTKGQPAEGESEADEEPELREFEERAQRPVYGTAPVDPVVKRMLEARGIERLYKHQAEALRLVRRGRNVVVTAPTASGKTEIFLIPIVEAAREGRRSLVVYPTKALSRDQLERFREFSILGVRSEVYDGDTPQHQRERIRRNMPHVLITNFDMLHFMLMNARLFGELWRTLRYVVVDEIHVYSGTLGAHVSNIVKRLKRVLEKYRNPERPRFICSSATIGNAKEFAEMLIGEKFSAVEAIYSPRTRIRHLLVNPPLRNSDRRASYTALALKFVEKLLAEKGKVLVFGNSHSVVERMGLMARQHGMTNFYVYRAGLSQKMRKELEREFKHGRIRALASTSALELGMDIGAVDAVVLAGYPGTISRVRQRIGRCGRKGQECVAIYVARDNPLDQYFFENPEQYLHGRPESCYVNPQNGLVLRWHLLAMMRDWPADEEEMEEFGGKEAMQVFEELKKKELCKPYAGGWIPTKEGLRELQRLSIRGTGDSVRIWDIERKEFIGERERAMALAELFPGAIYLHGGEKYTSEGLDLEHGIAKVRRNEHPTNEYTSALCDRSAEVIEVLRKRRAFGSELHYGRVHIHQVVHGFVVKNQFTEETLGRYELDEPLEHDFDTLAIWFDFPERIVRSVEKFPDGLHAVEHCSINMIPALTGADSGEIGGISYPSGRMFIYDGVPQGSGATGVVFGVFERMEEMARKRFVRCPCRRGCPSCMLDPQCGNNNQHLDKEAAKEILERLVGRK